MVTSLISAMSNESEQLQPHENTLAPISVIENMYCNDEMLK